ncbi:hypothetical protein AURDEDRAFT_148118 [Auricularia subglabra TFB-10046 SS5]|nr:hypothetical protein AURDEDRAFT_148118 [Auricularia subglabra TFB-10046 SS5]
MNTVLPLLVLLATAVWGQEKDKDRRVCLAEDPFEQLARHRQPVALPICAVDGSHRDVQTEAEILSFEEWKAQQLALGANDSAAAAAAATVAEPSPTPHPAEEPADAAPAEHQPTAPPPPSSSPTAPPSLKDRYNYASTDCSARVQSAHRQARSPDSILSHKKDRYMLSPCAAHHQHVVVELCDDIRIDTVQLANFEFFSGVFKDFRVSVSSTGEEWVLAGEYTAKNARGVQSFHPQRDLPNFYRYARIDFLSHYGNEFYCPVSLLRVYGLTQMEKFKQELAEEQHRAASAVPSAPPVVAMPAEPVTPPAEPTAETSPPPASDKTRGTSDVALRPTLEVSDLEKCATVTRAATTPSTSPASSPTSVPTADAAPPTVAVAPSPASASPTPPPANKPSTVAPAPAASPKPTVLTTGDSIYRTIMNRLAALEGNSTLVVRFVEQQALTIREALRRMEEDVGRLDGAAKGVARTLGELERERRELDEERVMLLRKVAALADEVVLEKRLGIAQLGLLVAVLLFLAVTRGSAAIAPLPLARSRTSSLFLQRPRPRVVSDPDPRAEAQALLNPNFSFAPKASPKPIPFPADAIRTPRARSRTPRRIDARPSIDLTSPRKPAPDSPRLRAAAAAAAESSGGSPRAREFAVARPRTPTHAVFSRLKRSNSHTTPGTRKLARTAHLHEVRSPSAQTPTGLFSPSPTPSDTEQEQEQEWVTEDETTVRRDEPWKLDESPLARRRRKLGAHAQVEVAG